MDDLETKTPPADGSSSGPAVQAAEAIQQPDGTDGSGDAGPNGVDTLGGSNGTDASGDADGSGNANTPDGYVSTVFIGEGKEPAARRVLDTSKYNLGSFNLRGHGINPIVDASMPLINLYIRLQESHAYDGVKGLHKQVHEEIQRIEIELSHQGYDRAVVLAHRYCLCTFIDEGVMRTPWGANSFWEANTMLSEFHNERWGGQKFFLVVDRMRGEPERYREMLEFLYICMSVGYQGRYRIENNGRIKFERILNDLHAQLERMHEEPGEFLTQPAKNITPRPIRYNKSFPYWGIALIALCLAAGVFGYFRVTMNGPLEEVIDLLTLQAQGVTQQDLADSAPDSTSENGG